MPSASSCCPSCCWMRPGGLGPGVGRGAVPRFRHRLKPGSWPAWTRGGTRCGSAEPTAECCPSTRTSATGCRCTTWSPPTSTCSHTRRRGVRRRTARRRTARARPGGARSCSQTPRARAPPGPRPQPPALPTRGRSANGSAARPSGLPPSSDVVPDSAGWGRGIRADRPRRRLPRPAPPPSRRPPLAAVRCPHTERVLRGWPASPGKLSGRRGARAMSAGICATLASSASSRHTAWRGLGRPRGFPRGRHHAGVRLLPTLVSRRTA